MLEIFSEFAKMRCHFLHWHCKLKHSRSNV